MKKIIVYSALILLIPFQIDCELKKDTTHLEEERTGSYSEINDKDSLNGADNRGIIISEGIAFENQNDRAESNVTSERKSSFNSDKKPAFILSDGILPWPHQRPGLTQAEYDDLINNLWIINNYGQYQASEDKSVVYFHDGLDIVLANGTMLYSMEPGYVKSALEYGQVTIGDTEGDNPGNGWMYVHVNNIQFQEGDYVNQGDYIADVYFEGLPHVHLSRCYVESGSWKDYTNLHLVHPDTYFLYEDTQPPVIKKPFYYFRNNTDELIGNAEPPVVSGEVDIVVGIRDPGEFAHDKTSGFGDRLCIARIEYVITGENIQPIYKKSFDFTKIILSGDYWDPYRRDRVFTVYKHYTIFHPAIDATFWDKTFSYYIITNTDGTGEFGEIDISAQDYAWNTAEVDGSGNAKFPDGLYYITVMAYDSLGNHSEATDAVRVRNGKKSTVIRR